MLFVENTCKMDRDAENYSATPCYLKHACVRACDRESEINTEIEDKFYVPCTVLCDIIIQYEPTK
jgi:hypothetical protein